MIYDPTNENDVYYVLTESLSDSVIKSFYCSCCRACSSSSSACIFPIPKPILLDQEWIVLSYHLSNNSFLSKEAFTHLLVLAKERMESLYPKGITLFHEGTLQPYAHPNAYLTTDQSFPFKPSPYTDIEKLYRLYSSLATYAQSTSKTIVWQCRWKESYPQIEFRLVNLEKASKEKGFYSLGLTINPDTKQKDRSIPLKALIEIPDKAHQTPILVPDSLDILHWNKDQCHRHQRVLLEKLRSLHSLSPDTIYLLGLYSVKLLQGGYRPEQLKQDILSLKWPSLIQSYNQRVRRRRI